MTPNAVTHITSAVRFLALAAAVFLAACASSGGSESAPAPGSQSMATSAAPELAQFGRFVGQWACTVQQRQADGSWQTQDGTASWRWTYALGGHAVQDFWQPADSASNIAGLGTNLRTWNRTTQQWNVVWATAEAQGFDFLQGNAAGQNMVLRMTKPPREGRPGHQARITFFDIQAQQFDWIYEASPLAGDPNGDQRWSALVQMRCQRQ